MLSGRLLAGVGLDVSPRQELVELAHGMTVGDFGEDVGEISLRIDVVHFFGGLDQRGVDRPVFSAIVQSGLIVRGLGREVESLIRSIPCFGRMGVVVADQIHNRDRHLTLSPSDDSPTFLVPAWMLEPGRRRSALSICPASRWRGCSSYERSSIGV